MINQRTNQKTVNTEDNRAKQQIQKCKKPKMSTANKSEAKRLHDCIENGAVNDNVQVCFTLLQ